MQVIFAFHSGPVEYVRDGAHRKVARPDAGVAKGRKLVPTLNQYVGDMSGRRKKCVFLLQIGQYLPDSGNKRVKRMNPASQHRPQNSRHEAEIALGIASLRLPLRGYLHTLIPDQAACDDLVQETLLFLWERRDSADESTPVRAWAFKVAWFKAMAWHRDHRRDRLVYFSDDVLQQMAPVAEAMSSTAENRLEALRLCLADLPADDLALLRLKYVDQGSLTHHAAGQGWKPNRVQKTLSRLRLALRHCIQSRLQSES